MSEEYLAPGLTRREFACKCGCGQSNPNPELLTLWTKIRTMAGPLIVNSGKRCREHNAAVGGTPDSAHIHGQAMDIRSATHSPQELYRLILNAYMRGELPELGGLGIYDKFVHIDTRRKGDNLRMWDNRRR